MQILFEDLREDIRVKRGLPVGAEVGFFDQREIELGQDWDDTIVEALQQSKVLLAVASPGYFKSEYSAKSGRCSVSAVSPQRVRPARRRRY